MNPQTKKGLIIVGVVGVLVFVATKLMAKKTPSATSGSVEGDTGGNTGGNTGGSTGGNDTQIVGMVALSKANDVFVRKEAQEYSNFAYNNIIGVLSAGEKAGTVTATAIGSDGKLWYAVERGSNYSCPYLTCGTLFSYNSGWVRASDVNLS